MQKKELFVLFFPVMGMNEVNPHSWPLTFAFHFACWLLSIHSSQEWTRSWCWRTGRVLNTLSSYPQDQSCACTSKLFLHLQFENSRFVLQLWFTFQRKVYSLIIQWFILLKNAEVGNEVLVNTAVKPSSLDVAQNSILFFIYYFSEKFSSFWKDIVLKFLFFPVYFL